MRPNVITRNETNADGGAISVAPHKEEKNTSDVVQAAFVLARSSSGILVDGSV